MTDVAKNLMEPLAINHLSDNIDQSGRTGRCLIAPIVSTVQCVVFRVFDAMGFTHAHILKPRSLQQTVWKLLQPGY